MPTASLAAFASLTGLASFPRLTAAGPLRVVELVVVALLRERVGRALE